MKKKVVYLNVCDQNVTVDFDVVKTENVGAYFYKNEAGNCMPKLVCFIPILKQFVIINREIEILDVPLC